MRAKLLLGLFVLASLLFTPAFAQSRKELAAQNIQLSQRLSALENRMLTGDPAAERLMQRMDAVEASMRALTGEVERLRYERDNLQEEVRTLASTLAELQTISEGMQRHLDAVNIIAQDTPAPSGEAVYGGGRMGGGVYSNGSSIAGPPTITSGAPDALNGNDVAKLAEIGLEKMQEGNFSEAQTIFKQYLELNPEATDRGDVYYLLGETYYIKGGYTDAADAYIASMRAAPNGIYAPESMIRLASTARALGQTNMACQTLASFPNEYPNASESVQGKARLEAQRSGC